ncbi:MAG: AAA family ATPase, partial [Dehalococcoidia bacterium]
MIQRGRNTTARTSSGTVTLLFTDRVGSTEQRQHLGEDEGNALRRTHDALLREQIGRTGGDEVKHLGDGLMVKFSSSIEALDCAVAIQQAVHRHNEQQADAHRRLDVRVGVHVGEPEHEAGDYFGSAVDIAKRLCDSAEGGQIVVSDLVRGIAGSRGSYTYQSIGALPLKGIAEPLPASVLQWTPSTVTAGAGPAPAQLPLPPLLAGADRTPFVGRERELEAIERGWERAKGGRSQLMLLAGEAGIGKTRLAAQFAAAAHDRGASVLYGRCDEGSVVRCQPFVEALRQVASGALAGELADAFQDDDDRERFALFERVTRVFREQPLAVLVLDDLHWADAATLQLLRFCFTSSAATSLFCIGTYRDTEVGRSHPLAELLADLRRARLGERIPLSGLDHEASRRLIEAASTASASPDVARVLHERTEGNPFFLEELLRDLAEEHSGDLPATVAAAAADIPEGVKDVIVRRLARLSDACNNVLTIAAVIGREFGIDALTRASALPPEQLEESLEDAVAARLVDEAPGTPGHYAFSHALTREALYDELSTTRRVRLHGQTLQYADNEGVKLAYEVLGATGPYVVAVGISNCAAGRPRDRAIAQHWDRVSQSCRLILYDRRGLGFSAAPDRGYSVVA